MPLLNRRPEWNWRWRRKTDRLSTSVRERFRPEAASQPRPRLCPACGTLVGSSSAKCHQCGASMTFSLSAASRSLSKVMPQVAPVTYVIVGVDVLLYGLSLLMTFQRNGGFDAPAGGLSGLLATLGGISNAILFRLGESLPLAYLVQQPWRLVMAVF